MVGPRPALHTSWDTYRLPQGSQRVSDETQLHVNCTFFTSTAWRKMSQPFNRGLMSCYILGNIIYLRVLKCFSYQFKHIKLFLKGQDIFFSRLFAKLHVGFHKRFPSPHRTISGWKNDWEYVCMNGNRGEPTIYMYGNCVISDYMGEEYGTADVQYCGKR